MTATVAHATEVQMVGVQADSESRIGLGCGTVVDLEGVDEKIHAGVVEVVVPGFAELESYLRAARAMERVGVFVLPTGVMEQREKPDDLLVGCMMTAEREAIAQDRAPVTGAMVGMDDEAEPGGDELPERMFERGEQVVGAVVWQKDL